MRIFVQQEARQLVTSGTITSPATLPPIFPDDNFRIEVTLLNPSAPVGLLASPCTVDSSASVVKFGLVSQLTGTTATTWCSGTAYPISGTYSGSLVVPSLGGLLGTLQTATPNFEVTVIGPSSFTVQTPVTVKGRGLH